MRFASSALVALLVLSLLPCSAPGMPPTGVDDVRLLSGLHSSRQDFTLLLAGSLADRGHGSSRAALSCDRCHRPCADCHRNGSGRFYFSSRRASGNEPCLGCHIGWGAFPVIDARVVESAVHFSGGMTCGTCHTGMSIDEGTPAGWRAADSEVKPDCGTCHAGTLAAAEHRVYAHGGKLSCGACHAAAVTSLMDVDLDALLGDDFLFSTPVRGWLFLVDDAGKVAPANIRTFVAGDGLRVDLFSRSSSHLLLRRGRTCGECHDAFAVREALAGCLKLTWRQGNELANLTGVIPVAEGVRYETACPDGAAEPSGESWCREDPIVVFSGGCRPLTAGQMEKLHVYRSFPADSREEVSP